MNFKKIETYHNRVNKHGEKSQSKERVVVSLFLTYSFLGSWRVSAAADVCLCMERLSLLFPWAL